jgi:hypothetical protein
MFTTTDERIFFVDPPVADQIEQAAKGGRPIRVGRIRKARGGFEWIVEPKDEGAAGERPAVMQMPAPQPAPEPDAGNTRHPVTTAQAKLMAALCVAIDSAAEATQYAKQRGMPLSFTGEDIRCMANTIIIGNEQRGAR